MILDGNPLGVDTDKILDIKVVETLKKGKSVYTRPAASARKAA